MKRLPSALVKTLVNSPIAWSVSPLVAAYNTMSERSLPEIAHRQGHGGNPQGSRCRPASTHRPARLVHWSSCVTAYLRDKAVFDILKWRRRLFTSLRACLSPAASTRSQRKSLWDLQQLVQDQEAVSPYGFFHRKHADKVVAYAQMTALGFNVGNHDLIVKKLCGLRRPAMPPRHS